MPIVTRKRLKWLTWITGSILAAVLVMAVLFGSRLGIFSVVFGDSDVNAPYLDNITEAHVLAVAKKAQLLSADPAHSTHYLSSQSSSTRTRMRVEFFVAFASIDTEAGQLAYDIWVASCYPYHTASLGSFFDLELSNYVLKTALSGPAGVMDRRPVSPDMTSTRSLREIVVASALRDLVDRQIIKWRRAHGINLTTNSLREAAERMTPRQAEFKNRLNALLARIDQFLLDQDWTVTHIQSIRNNGWSVWGESFLSAAHLAILRAFHERNPEKAMALARRTLDCLMILRESDLGSQIVAEYLNVGLLVSRHAPDPVVWLDETIARGREFHLSPEQSRANWACKLELRRKEAFENSEAELRKRDLWPAKIGLQYQLAVRRSLEKAYRRAADAWIQGNYKAAAAFEAELMNSSFVLHASLQYPVPSTLMTGAAYNRSDVLALFLAKHNPECDGIAAALDGTIANDYLDENMALLGAAKQRFKIGRQPGSNAEFASALPAIFFDDPTTSWTILAVPAAVRPLAYEYYIKTSDREFSSCDEAKDPFISALRNYWKKNRSIPNRVELIAPYAKDTAQLESWKERFVWFPQTAVICAIRVPPRAFYWFQEERDSGRDWPWSGMFRSRVDAMEDAMRHPNDYCQIDIVALKFDPAGPPIWETDPVVRWLIDPNPNAPYPIEKMR